MFARSAPAAAQLRRFVRGRRPARASGIEWLISEAALQLLTPPLKDVLEAGADQDPAVRLTYATASVMISDLLAQRFPGVPWIRSADGAIRRIADRGGLDADMLLTQASEAVAALEDVQPAAHLKITQLIDAAIDRSIFQGERAQGEVQLRLALERLEQAAARTAPPDREPTPPHGLLRVVRIRARAPDPAA